MIAIDSIEFPAFWERSFRLIKLYIYEALYHIAAILGSLPVPVPIIAIIHLYGLLYNPRFRGLLDFFWFDNDAQVQYFRPMD